MTEIIHRDVRYLLMLTAMYHEDKRSKDQHFPRFSQASFHASGMSSSYGLDSGDVAIALREMVAIGHFTRDGYWYFTTQEGRDWLEVEAAIRRSEDDARANASKGG